MTNAPVYRTVDEVLQGRPATTVTRRLVRTAIEGGLRPHLDPPVKRRKNARPEPTYRIMLDYPARDGLFGALHVSAESGVVLRANLCHGNNGREVKYTTVADIRRQLNAWWRTQHMKEA